jgi:thioredoxin reductase
MNIPNIHPADELAAIREEIKQLEKHEADLRAKLLKMSDAEREGDQYRAFVIISNRESLDKASLIAAFGREAVEPYIKTTNVQTLKTARKTSDAHVEIDP